MGMLKNSRTIRFQAFMAALDAVVIAPQVIEPFLSTQALGIVVLILSAIHKAGNVYLRTITTTPLK